MHIIKRALLPTVVAVTLAGAMALPALAAGPPTFSGTPTCEHPQTHDIYDLNPVEGATHQDLASLRLFWQQSGFCVPGTVDFSGLTQDA